MPGTIWVKEGSERRGGVDIGARMTVVRLNSGALLVHRPLALDRETRSELSSLGKVRYVVAPNDLRAFPLRDWARRYPRARVYAAPGYREKFGEKGINGTLGDSPSSAWSAEMDQIVVRGSNSICEIAFYHRRTRTLILSDLMTNYDAASPWVTRMAMRLAGVFDRPASLRQLQWKVNDRGALQLTLRKILQWRFESVILAHGSPIAEEGRDAVRRAFLWAYR